jgi:DNA-binding response OmpR family regulator
LANKHKILIVDDDMDILTSMIILLRNKGYQVEGTLNGEETMVRTERFRPDLIIMDVLLSDVNGKDICKKLKEDNETKSIPVILISANEQLEKTIKDCGANAFINKPFTIPYLLGEVEGYLHSELN